MKASVSCFMGVVRIGQFGRIVIFLMFNQAMVSTMGLLRYNLVIAVSFGRRGAEVAPFFSIPGSSPIKSQNETSATSIACAFIR